MLRRTFFKGVGALSVAAFLGGDFSEAVPKTVGATVPPPAPDPAPEPNEAKVPDLWVLPVRCARCGGQPTLTLLPPLLLADRYVILCDVCGPGTIVCRTVSLIARYVESTGPYAPVTPVIDAWNQAQDEVLRLAGHQTAVQP